MKLSANKETKKVLANANSLTDYKPLYGQDQFKVKYDSYFGVWTSPFVMETINTRIVRRSNFLYGGHWGENFSYHETSLSSKGSKGFLSAEAVRLVSGFIMLSAKNKYSWKFTERFLPKKGSGPNKEQRDNGYFRTWIHGIDGGEHKRKVLFTGPKDPGYGSTAIMIAESAICIARAEAVDNFGVGTPAYLLGLPLADRLRDKEFKIEYSDIEKT